MYYTCMYIIYVHMYSVCYISHYMYMSYIHLCFPKLLLEVYVATCMFTKPVFLTCLLHSKSLAIWPLSTHSTLY